MGECYGVLLYYKYYHGGGEAEEAAVDLEALESFYESNCRSLSLLGRVRLSPSGVNVTVGGEVRALEKHIEAVKCVGGGKLFQDTDFKLATCAFPTDPTLARQCGFTSLSIRLVKELVTFSSYPLLNPPHISNAGTHLSALDFHSLLHNAGQLVDTTSSLADNQAVVLLDARNLYETRIGKFQTPGIETLDAGIRQYSDLPSWIDDHTEQLQGKQVLMYCTGGIRCEMASAYIKSKGAGFENVFQLFGGIQRYLEQFPDGGFFKGKNFVFDHRISVGSSDTKVLGTCLVCSVSFDDYSSRCRCSHCRMLVLICDNCQTKEAIYLCELCRKNGKNIGKTHLIGDGKPEEIIPVFKPGANVLETLLSQQLDQVHDVGAGPSRKLRILCLHGFRQNASSFKGRTASLAKKLKNMAELVYVDAPHELPFIYQPCVTESSNCSSQFPSERVPPNKCNRKFAWLVGHDHNGMSENEWKMSDAMFDPLQYQQQTEGFDVSLAYLKTVFSQQRPFDGILGFSQGAAMTALVCAQKERLKHEMDFRFAILCSGFVPYLGEIQSGSINCPSLHIFGSLVGKDRQIATHASRDLAMLFVEDCLEIVEHDCGHIIPTRPPFIDKIKSFLQSFV